MTSIYELIIKRSSVRNYSNKKIEKDKIQELKDYLDLNKKGPLGSKVRFNIVDANDYDHAELKKLGTYGLIKGPRVFIAGVVKRNETAMEDFGYCMEKNVLKATSLGLGTCWLGGSLKRSTFAQKMNAQDDVLLPAVTPIGYALEKQTVTETLVRLVTGANSRKKREELFFDQSIHTPLNLNTCGEYDNAIEAIRLAPSASNKQPWRIIKELGDTYHFFMKENTIYNNAFKDIKIQNVDMGIAMCHFELTALELGLNGKWEQKNPLIESGDLKYIVSWVSATI